ncbi:MAG: hypothetical protein E6Q67_10900 [Roseateles sp.]|nr:MAG: hypothetical protein E6Q67_10900 [Roseateles sp.]
MQTEESHAALDLDGSIAAMPLLAAAELQDHLMTVTNDLERLQRLLDDAGEALSTHFYSASNQVMSLQGQAGDAGAVHEGLKQIMQEIAGAITALQFQDMATQLIAHTSQRLRNCADQIARDTFGADDEDGIAIVEVAPLRPNPVTQDEMDAGSIELF